MILYMDTSDLFKMYVREEDWPRPLDSVAMADRLASSRLAFVEMRAALRRAFAGGRLSRDGKPIGQVEYGDLVRDFGKDRRDFIKVDASAGLLREAADLAEKHQLKAADAIHLSAGIRIRNLAVEDVHFSVNDQELRSAALAEGFVVV